MVDLIKAGKVDLSINTPRSKQGRRDSYEIRRAAVDFSVPYITTIRGSRSRQGMRSRLLLDEMEVHRKLSGLDCETWTLVEMFSMADGGKLPDVEL